MNSDNNNVPIESGSPNRQTLIIVMSGIVLIGVCGLIALGYFWFTLGSSSSLSHLFAASATVTPFREAIRTPEPTAAAPLPSQATLPPLSKAEEAVTFASAEEAGAAFNAGNEYLETYTINQPTLPDVNKPGDVYTYNIDLQGSIPLLWSYGWCTTTKDVLANNFEHMQIKFVADDVTVTALNIATNDNQRQDGSPCKENFILVSKWTPGKHHFETRITFTQDVNDGWNTYPSGTHTYEYNINVYP